MDLAVAYHPRVSIDDAPRGEVGTEPAADTWVKAAVIGFIALSVVLQFAATRAGIRGPLHSLINNYIATPQSVTVPWAGLGLAMVGLTKRRRIIALSLAAGIDVVFAVGRLLRGGAFTLGNAPLIVLTGLALMAWLRWSGVERRNALRGVALGGLLVVASECAETWLDITAISRPKVLDEYVMLADHVLAQPSWLVGRVIDAAGEVPYWLLHWVYIELPVAAMMVAVYQLRNVTTRGWPRHDLVRTFLVLGVVGPAIYMLFPVVGPTYAFGTDGQGFQVGDYWPTILPPVDLSPHAVAFDHVTARNCMPSMHLAWALAVFVHSRGGARWARWGGTLWLSGTIIATLGFGYHYGVDLIAGAVLCLTVEAALRDPERGWGRFRIWLVVSGVVLLTALLLCWRYLAVFMAHWPLLFGPPMIGALALFTAAFSLAFYPAFFARQRKMWSQPSEQLDAAVALD